MIPRNDELAALITIGCANHQREPWSGFLSCRKCHKVYHYEVAPVYCQCGALFRVEVDSLIELLTAMRFDHLDQTSGRPICKHCAQEAIS